MVNCVGHIHLTAKVGFANGDGIFDNLDDVLNMLLFILFLICYSLFCKCSGKAVYTFNYYGSVSHINLLSLYILLFFLTQKKDLYIY